MKNTFNYNYSFTFAGSSVTNGKIRHYMHTHTKSAFSWDLQRKSAVNDNLGDRIIRAIANNDYSVNQSDSEIYPLLEEFVKECGYDSNGVYGNDAHAAMQNLCSAQGKNSNEYVLFDKNFAGRKNKIVSKIKNVFGFGKKQEEKQEQNDTAPKQKKWMYRITTTVAGLAVVGAGLFVGQKMSDNATNQTPNFKTVKTDSVSHKSVQTYDIARNQPASDSISVALTRSSKSALNILLNEKKATDLCNQVQRQMDAGIFVAPHGMSAERIAHAITMSRIYEGTSIIIDALNSKTKLTPAQQTEFNQHIDEIGDMGVKLQKKMTTKQKLSQHSQFNKASKTMRQVHVQNLKHLHQLRKTMSNGK